MNIKNFPARLDEIAREKGVDRVAIEIWFADEARIGQKNKITRRWAKRGTRPSAPHDQRVETDEDSASTISSSLVRFHWSALRCRWARSFPAQLRQAPRSALLA
jgi:hypothetical protein